MRVCVAGTISKAQTSRRQVQAMLHSIKHGFNQSVSAKQKCKDLGRATVLPIPCATYLGPKLAQGCSFSCRSSCHKQMQWKSSSLWDNVLGLFVLGCSFGSCNACSCENKQTSKIVTIYTFPWWLIRRAVFTTICSQGPELLLRVQRVRPKDAAIFLALENNQMETMKKLILVGKASILDVNEDGQSLLHVSIYPRPMNIYGY